MEMPLLSARESGIRQTESFVVIQKEMWGFRTVFRSYKIKLNFLERKTKESDSLVDFVLRI